MFDDIKLKWNNFKIYLEKPTWHKLFSKDKFITPDFRLEQYFFTIECAKEIVNRLDRFDNPCCLCAPRLGKEWFDRGRIVRILDIDKRFSFLPGYKYYDLENPHALDEKFDIIVADPNLSLEEIVILRAINTISNMNYHQKLLILYETEKEASLLKTFQAYDLHPTQYYPIYCNITDEGRRYHQFYANFNFP